MRLFQLVYMAIYFIDEFSIHSGCVVIDLHELSCILFEDIKLYLKKKKKNYPHITNIDYQKYKTITLVKGVKSLASKCIEYEVQV